MPLGGKPMVRSHIELINIQIVPQTVVLNVLLFADTVFCTEKAICDLVESNDWQSCRLGFSVFIVSKKETMCHL